MAADKAGPDVGGECGKAMVGPSLRVPLPGGGRAPAIAAAAKFLERWPPVLQPQLDLDVHHRQRRRQPWHEVVRALYTLRLPQFLHVAFQFRASILKPRNDLQNKTGLAVLAFKRARARFFKYYSRCPRFRVWEEKT